MYIGFETTATTNPKLYIFAVQNQWEKDECERNTTTLDSCGVYVRCVSNEERASERERKAQLQVITGMSFGSVCAACV